MECPSYRKQKRNPTPAIHISGPEVIWARDSSSTKFRGGFMAELTPTQQAMAENDAREGAKALFDPKVHGVGTVAPVAPANVTEMFKLHEAFKAEVEDASDDMTLPATGLVNSLMSRLDQLEKKVASMLAPPAPPASDLGMGTGTGSNTETGQTGQPSGQFAPSSPPFAKKKEPIQ
jgi:hypothetical protein